MSAFVSVCMCTCLCDDERVCTCFPLLHKLILYTQSKERISSGSNYDLHEYVCGFFGTPVYTTKAGSSIKDSQAPLYKTICIYLCCVFKVKEWNGKEEEEEEMFHHSGDYLDEQ